MVESVVSKMCSEQADFVITGVTKVWKKADISQDGKGG